MKVDALLARIAYHGPRRPDPRTLRDLHRQHLYTVPFENLDIPLDRPIALSVPSFYDKIVRRRRGGFCYELNGLFGWLIEQLGFRVELLSGRVLEGGGPGVEFDHLLLLVEAGERWIADVGFGDLFLEPVRLDTAREQQQDGFSFQVSGSGSERVLHRRRQGESEWEPQYAFSLTPRRLEEFGARCAYFQTSPESHFRQKAVCSRATPSGRITLANGRWIATDSGERSEREVAGEKEYRTLLKEHFGIELEPDVAVSKLMSLQGPSGG